jgi:hypothetical protein
MRTEATLEEKKWWARLVKLMKAKPATMILFADGDLCGIDRETNDEHLSKGTGLQPLDLTRIPGVDGGDPWKC